MQRVRENLRDIYLAVLHLLAMNTPYRRLNRTFYRMRGTKLGQQVQITPRVFIEETYPQYVTIEDYVHIGPGSIIVAHDSSYHCINPEIPLMVKPVLIKRHAFIGAGAIILPGITIGEFSIVAAGAVVTEDVPPRSIVAGVPARIVGNVDEKLNSVKNSYGPGSNGSEGVR